MNSDAFSLVELAQAWQTVPFADAIGRASEQALSMPVQDNSHASFILLLTRTAGLFLAARGRDDTHALGQAVEWLTSLGVLESQHLAFSLGDPHAAESIVLTMRDACLGQVQREYRGYLLARYCATWDKRVSLAGQWLTKQELIPVRQPWELTEALADMLETVGAGQRLAEQLRKNDYWRLPVMVLPNQRAGE